MLMRRKFARMRFLRMTCLKNIWRKIERMRAMVRDEDGQLTDYVYIDLNTTDYGGFVDQASKLLREKLQLSAGYSYQWSGEYEFQLRAKERLKFILPVVFFEFACSCMWSSIL